MKICTTEDIDVHINNQKQPVFLISSDTKPQQRAKILSLGKESLYIQKIMETIKSKTKLFRQDEKLGEIRFAQINKILDVLDNIENQVNNGKILKKNYIEAVEQLANVQNSKEFLKQWIINDQLIQLGNITIPNTPEVINTDEYNFIYKNWTLNSSILEIGEIKDIPDTPDVQDTAEAKEICKNFKLFKTLSSVGSISDLVKVPEIIDTTPLLNGLKNFNVVSQLSKVGVINTDIHTPNLTDTTQMGLGLQQWNKLTTLSSVGLLEIPQQLPPLNSTKEAEDLLTDWKHSLQMISNKQKEYEILLAEQKKVELELEDYFKNIGNVCPTCKQPVSSEHIHNI